MVHGRVVYALQHDGRGVCRVGHPLILSHGPVEPSHEEQAKGESVRAQDHVGVRVEPPGVDVPHHVVLEDGHAVKDVGAGFPVWEPVKKPAKVPPLPLLSLLLL